MIVARIRRHPPQPGLHVRVPRAARRRGIAAVEFALVTPLLAGVIIGVLELNRGLMAKQILDQAARKGCETASLVLQNNATVIGDINNVLSSNNIDASAVTITILVNGAANDVIQSKFNDKISVSVSIPVSKVSWTSTYQYLVGSTVESETVIMSRRG
jgi:Flp pilus assembly protein TadG